MQEIIAGLRVQCLANRAKLAFAQLIRYWTSEPVIISCIRSSLTGGNFLAVVKSFDANSAISSLSGYGCDDYWVYLPK